MTRDRCNLKCVTEHVSLYLFISYDCDVLIFISFTIFSVEFAVNLRCKWLSLLNFFSEKSIDLNMNRKEINDMYVI